MREVGAELGHQVRKERIVRFVGCVDGTALERGRYSTSLGLLVDETDEFGSDHGATNFAFDDAGEEALVYQHGSGFQAALQVAALANRRPLTRLGGTSIQTELHKLRHRVLLHMVVVRFHQDNLGIEIGNGVSVRLAILRLILELADPDTLALRTTILFQDSWLESNRLSESLHERFGRCVDCCVLQTDAKVLDLDERVLASNRAHHFRCRHDKNTSVTECRQHVVQLGLSRRRDGSRIDPNNETRCCLEEMFENDTVARDGLFVGTILIVGKEKYGAFRIFRSCDVRTDGNRIASKTSRGILVLSTHGFEDGNEGDANIQAILDGCRIKASNIDSHGTEQFFVGS
mmetsp:Transcript_6842/g.9982  ORF Transcript_6842/g.9982 Transcript_6842/m.9982 type:complete len:346 (+) Transcript_6842:404-1441(+)